MGTNENRTKVAILTGTYHIEGFIDLIPGSRLTDYMDGAREFLAVTDAEVFESNEGIRHVMKAPFLNVSRNHIQIVTPL